MYPVAADTAHILRIRRGAEISEVLRLALEQADAVKVDVQRTKRLQIISGHFDSLFLPSSHTHFQFHPKYTLLSSLASTAQTVSPAL